MMVFTLNLTFKLAVPFMNTELYLQTLVSDIQWGGGGLGISKLI